MKRLAILALLGLALLSCSREDPRKPHQVLEDGRSALLAGDLARAQSELELAVAKADRAQIDWVRMKSYAVPLFQAYALQGKVDLAVKIFDRANRPGEDFYLFPREGNNLMALYARAGSVEDALRIAEKLAHTLDVAGSNFTPHLRLLVWANIDRALFAGGDAEGAQAAGENARSELNNLARFRDGRHWPLEPGMKAWLARYASYLGLTGRAEEAAEVEGLAAQIESNSPAPEASPRCVAAGDPPLLGCVLDVPVGVLAVPGPTT
jgi:tetratricopeptide (TPR) repeat protein